MSAIARSRSRVLFFLLLFSLFPLQGCSVGAGGACRSTAECAGGLGCLGPDDPPGCGIPPRQGCASNQDCRQPDEVCHAIPDSCSRTGVGSECRPKCDANVKCGPDFRCNAAGACEPVPCDQGFSCPARQRCDPGAAHARGPVYSLTQGCVDIPCAADGECPAAKACTNGYCQDGAGVCREIIAVP